VFHFDAARSPAIAIALWSLAATACIGGGGGTGAGTGGGPGGGADVQASDSGGGSDATASDTASTAADATGGADGAVSDTTSVADTSVADSGSGDSAADGTVKDAIADGKDGGGTTTDGGASDINFDVKGGQTCCQTSDKPGCADSAVQACVCAKDAYCCNNKWDSVCVGKVNSLKCGVCEKPDAGPTDSAPSDVAKPDGGGGKQSCCVESTDPKCIDEKIAACVCAEDNYCCTTKWDSICVGEVEELGCGTCGGSGSDAGSGDTGKTDAGSTDAGSTDASGGTDSAAVDGGAADVK